MSAPDDDKDVEQMSAGSGLRVVPQADEGRRRPALDPELKAVLDDLKRRYGVMRERLEGETDAPDAA